MNTNDSTQRLERYTDRALDCILAELASAEPGDRNGSLNRAAFALGQLEARGLVSNPERILTDAGRALGLDSHEVRSTVRSGLRAGRRRPRRLPDELEDARRGLVPVTRAALPHPTEPEPVYKTEDAWRVWKACQRVTADEEVSAYLHGRDIDPDETDRLDLARALPRDYRATYTIHAPDGVPRTWAETGYRLIVPMYDHRGEFRSVLAHDLTRSRPARKSTTRGERKGLVMANPIGWILLAQGRAPIGRGDTPQVVWVAEGETDFLSTACGPDRDSTWGGPTAPAVIGVVAGSWTAELAARIPDGSYVLVGTDHNPAGDRYAQSIADTLCHRCNVRRVRIS